MYVGTTPDKKMLESFPVFGFLSVVDRYGSILISELRALYGHLVEVDSDSSSLQFLPVDVKREAFTHIEIVNRSELCVGVELCVEGVYVCMMYDVCYV